MDFRCCLWQSLDVVRASSPLVCSLSHWTLVLRVDLFHHSKYNNYTKYCVGFCLLMKPSYNAWPYLICKHITGTSCCVLNVWLNHHSEIVAFRRMFSLHQELHFNYLKPDWHTFKENRLLWYSWDGHIVPNHNLLTGPTRSYVFYSISLEL